MVRGEDVYFVVGFLRQFISFRSVLLFIVSIVIRCIFFILFVCWFLIYLEFSVLIFWSWFCIWFFGFCLFWNLGFFQWVVIGCFWFLVLCVDFGRNFCFSFSFIDLDIGYLVSFLVRLVLVLWDVVEDLSRDNRIECLFIEVFLCRLVFERSCYL